MVGCCCRVAVLGETERGGCRCRRSMAGEGRGVRVWGACWVQCRLCALCAEQQQSWLLCRRPAAALKLPAAAGESTEWSMIYGAAGALMRMPCLPRLSVCLALPG